MTRPTKVLMTTENAMIFASVLLASSIFPAPRRRPMMIPTLEPKARKTTLNRLFSVLAMFTPATALRPLVE